MDARKVAEQAINDLFDISEREGRCISKGAATDLLERHILAGLEIQPGFNADGSTYTLITAEPLQHTHITSSYLIAGTEVHCGGGWCLRSKIGASLGLMTDRAET